MKSTINADETLCEQEASKYLIRHTSFLATQHHHKEFPGESLMHIFHTPFEIRQVHRHLHAQDKL